VITIPRHMDNQQSFPAHLLEGLETALVLFSSAFNGAQDAVWIMDAGLTATCVDIDQEALDRMQGLYPVDWEFVNADAFQFCEEGLGRWDIVTVDCPSGAFAKCSGLVGLWCNCARRYVILGTGIRTEVEPPDGWEIIEKRRRSSYDGGVYWTVLERRP
jgi:hypothetical protein